jgi:hypothetical protein
VVDLVDHLVESSYRDLPVIDMSDTALTPVRGGIADVCRHDVLDVVDVLGFHPADASACRMTAPCSTSSPSSTSSPDYPVSLELACNRPATS